MSYQVKAGEASGFRLNAGDSVEAVLQNIALILATPKGSVPFYRTFGLSQEFLDKPMPVAKARMIAEIREAIEEWEPRATVLSVSFSEDSAQPGRLCPEVEVEVSLDSG